MGKTVNRLDSITTYRERTPTNPKTAYKAPNMAWDHSRQMNIIPDIKPRVMIEATNHGGGSARRCMNDSGRSASTLPGVSVGGSADHPGKVYNPGNVSPRGSGRGKTASPSFKGR